MVNDLIKFLFNFSSFTPEGFETRQHCAAAWHNTHQRDTDIRIWICGELSQHFAKCKGKAWCLYDESVNILWHDRTFTTMWKVSWKFSLLEISLLFLCFFNHYFCCLFPPSHQQEWTSQICLLNKTFALIF